MGARISPRCPQSLVEYIDRLRSQFDLDAVILFGSRARGEGDEFSDWDLFVIGRGFPSDWQERMKAVRRGKPVGVDVFAWTEQEVRRYIYRTFIQDIAIEGVALYGDMGWMRELAEQQTAKRTGLQPELARESLP